MDENNIRKELIKGTIEEIMGPRFGHDEVIGYDPWEEYLIGVVIPSSWNNNDILPDSDDTEESDYISSSEGSTDVKTITLNRSSNLDPRSQIKSFGISFLVNSDEPEFDVCVTWGRYFSDKESENAFFLNGELKERNSKDVFWKRASFGEIVSVIYEEKYEKGDYLPVYISDDGEINLFIKIRRIKEGVSHVFISFRNDLYVANSINTFKPDTSACIFQPSIRIILNNGQSIELNSSNKKDELLDFLYRNKPVFASGNLCSVIWEDIDYSKEFSEFKDLIWPEHNLSEQNEEYLRFKKPHIRSEFLPLYPINLPDFDLKEKINDLELKPSILCNYSQNQLFDNFNLLIKEYSDWIGSNKQKAVKLYNAGEISDKNYDLIFKEDGLIDNQEKIVERLESGIDLLESDELVYLAFCFANKTISLQDEWKKEVSDDDKIFTWRIFQIAFILLNLKSICDEESDDKQLLDLLWIPTGGGKTEAYLGLMAFTMALRRLKSYFGKSNEKTGAGVSIISRYTLRLLTVQQFRRTLKMVTAAEYLRVFRCENGSVGWRPKNCRNNDDWIYGSVRFSVGMWVGGAVTPLHLNYSDRGAMNMLKRRNYQNVSGNPAQILKCPVCGSWLSIQKNQDITDSRKNQVHIVIKTKMKENEISNKISHFKKYEFIKEDINITSEGLMPDYYVLSFIFTKKIFYKDYKLIIKNLKNYFEIASLNDHDIGYFGSRGPFPNSPIDDTDFEIWCANPECHLNHFWSEGSPDNSNQYKFPDGNYERVIKSPFKINTKIPIPAYLVDEQVYHRCPTVIVSTADKIARLAFEPRAGSLFGNVDYYNKYHGYCRKGLFPPKTPEGSTFNEFNTNVNPFLAPDLIIQDELHLMNGPLGSLFGLYEVMVSALIEQQKGNPKYIASTATIKNAEHQSKMLFSKKVSQFPPYGIQIEDSFFVHESEDNIWDNSKDGRVYMGIYAPGMGAFTHQVRVYCRLLKIAQDNHNLKKHITPYWTIVGYYNTIRELGSAVALYKDDMLARIKHISPINNVREIKLEGDNIELSSRIDSTKLPIILDDIENDGFNDNLPEYNALFTTSMFGTGVDISHLSIMIMNAQPKTTGDYIQATGRIGRQNGGFIVDLFRSGRPRDLNHYELFPSYHSRIYREVEPVSVSPFSDGCLDKGLGPSFVAFLRNSRGLKENWTTDDAKVILNKESEVDISYYRKFLKVYLEKMKFSDERILAILNKFDDGVKEWIRIANLDDKLFFMEYIPISRPDKSPKKNVVLGDPAHEKYKKPAVFKNSPQSLREIEDTLGFWV